MYSVGNGQHYQISFFGTLAQELKKLKKRANAAGLGSAYVAALEYAIFRMQHDPWGFGELKALLQHARLHIHVAVIKPLIIEFGIHEDKPIVLIKSVRLSI
jgi:hypothetical protein